MAEQMTDAARRALEGLIETWRAVANSKLGPPRDSLDIAYWNGRSTGLRSCADELEAALAALPPAPAGAQESLPWCAEHHTWGCQQHPAEPAPPAPVPEDELRQIVGALKSAIDAHGPITRDLLHSAAKRILAQLRAADSSLVPSSSRVRENGQAGDGHDRQ